MTLASLMGFDALFTILSASQCRKPVAFSLLSEDANGYQEEGDGLDSGNHRNELVPAQQPMERGCY